MAAFQAKAEHLGISLLWIPKGATGIYQPLDRRVFGALISKGRAKWRSHYFEHNSPCDTETAASLLIASWNELPDSVIAAGWNFDEPQQNSTAMIHRMMKNSSLILIPTVMNWMRVTLIRDRKMVHR
jgi:hypothetical protein